MLPRCLASLVLVAPLAACLPTPAHPIDVAVVVDGDRAAIGEVARDAVAGLALDVVAPPTVPAQPHDDRSAPLVRARTAYAKGEFDACRSELAAVDVSALLADGERVLAARALALETACALGALDRAAAQVAAARFASFGLELPESAVAPDAERVIGDAITASGGARRAPVSIAAAIGSRIAIDGRAGQCIAPCVIDLAPGDHVLAVDADGFVRASQRIRVVAASEPNATAAPMTVAITQASAPPELAGQQWLTRIAHGLPAADATGARLIGSFARASRVAYVHGDVRLTGALVVDGKLAADASRDAGRASELVRELAYDGGVLPRPRVWQRPWFWIAISAGVAAIAGTIVAVTYHPPIHTSVGF